MIIMSKAVLLFSGGLDSILAAYILKREGVKVSALYCHTVFSLLPEKKANNELYNLLMPIGIPLKIIDISSEHINIVKHPRYGYGKNLNPCVDCKIMMFKKASMYKDSIGADFVASGEVLGERPMSQRKNIFNVIERDSGLTGMILRPLSAKLLKPTIADNKGLVKRDNLYDIQGRGRRGQFILADKFGIKNFPTPSGGCLLTDPSFCRRLQDTITYKPDFGVYDCELLKVGRHFRLSPDAKLIVSRNESENEKIEKLIDESSVYFYPYNAKGPLSLASGTLNGPLIKDAVSIIARYCKVINTPLKIKMKSPSGESVLEVNNVPGLEKKSRGLLI